MADHYLNIRNTSGIQELMQGAIKAVLNERPDQPLPFLAEHFAVQVESPSPLLKAYRTIEAFTRSPDDDDQAWNNLLASTYSELSRSKASTPWLTHEELIVLIQALLGEGRGGPKGHMDCIITHVKDHGKIADKSQVTCGKLMTYIKAIVLTREVAMEAKAVWQGDYEVGEAMDLSSLISSFSLPSAPSTSRRRFTLSLHDALQKLESQLRQQMSSPSSSTTRGEDRSLTPLELWNMVFPLTLKIVQSSSPPSTSSSLAPSNYDSAAAASYALEVQEGWAECLLSGSKTIETRGYALPDKLAGQELLLIESPTGGLAKHGLDKGKAVGLVVFGSSRLYETRQAWKTDCARHLVAPEASAEKFGWSDSDVKYGWEVSSIQRLSSPYPYRLQEKQRLLRSIFRISSES